MNPEAYLVLYAQLRATARAPIVLGPIAIVMVINRSREVSTPNCKETPTCFESLASVLTLGSSGTLDVYKVWGLGFMSLCRPWSEVFMNIAGSVVAVEGS